MEILNLKWTLLGTMILKEKSSTDMETVKIDKWNQSTDKYKDGNFHV